MNERSLGQVAYDAYTVACVTYPVGTFVTPPAWGLLPRARQQAWEALADRLQDVIYERTYLYALDTQVHWAADDPGRRYVIERRRACESHTGTWNEYLLVPLQGGEAAWANEADLHSVEG